MLVDILNDIINMEKYLSENQNFDTYDKYFLLQYAVERDIITIGEAIKMILKLNLDIKISNSRNIVDARNKLTHGYDEMENLQIWSIII